MLSSASFSPGLYEAFSDLFVSVVSQRLQGALEMAMVLASEYSGEHW